MKARYKSILMSLLALVVGISLITGATLALFAKESKHDIVISTAKVEVNSEAFITGTKTYDTEWTEYSPGVKEAVLDKETSAAIDEDGNITFGAAKYGDRVRVSIPVTNASSIDISYRLTIAQNTTFDWANIALDVTENGKTVSFNEEDGKKVSKWSFPVNAVQNPDQPEALTEYVIEFGVADNSVLEGDVFDFCFAIEAIQANAVEDELIGASVSGIAGYEGVIFDTIQDAYNEISPIVAELAGLEQDALPVAQNEKFDALFTNEGYIEWTIYGEQVVDSSLIFSFGRKASYYNNERSIQGIILNGGNDSAELLMNTSVVLPYNWWSENLPTTSMTIDGITLTGKQFSFAPSNGYKYNMKIINSNINGKLYFYWNNDFDLTIDNCNFNDTYNDSYALHIQGNDDGSKAPVVKFTNNTVDGYSRGINLDCDNATYTVSGNTFKNHPAFLAKAAIQVTQGASFDISNNTFDSTLSGGAIRLHDLLNNATVNITDNVINCKKYISDELTEENRPTVTINQSGNTGTYFDNL